MVRLQNSDGTVPGQWWTHLEDPAQPDSLKVLCQLCPRHCHLNPGDKGFCFVRENREGQMVLNTYGRSTGFCIDPIEKKPLNHFLPGTPILSFGTAGCNLGCKFCQNWDISKSREVERLSHEATPEGIAQAALSSGCRSVAFTYNDPVIWAEYAIDTAIACHEVGIKAVAVTAGYITAEARPQFFEHMDAANVDLKAFSEEFYYRVTSSHLQPVLDTLVYLKNETNVWFELTNLLIPQANDSADELKQMCDWITAHLGVDVPIHFTAFHPDFRMLDRPRTPHETLIQAREIAKQAGIRYAYVGNVNDVERQSTYCPSCHKLLIQRDWHQLGAYHIQAGRCQFCQTTVAGHFEDQPGTWGRKRLPIAIPSSKSIVPNQKEPTMTTATIESQQKAMLLLRATSATVCGAIFKATMDNNAALPEALEKQIVHGVFVTLKRHGHLRGCRGVLGEPMRLGDALRQAAYQTACNDTRMPAISPIELPYLSVGITLLGPMQTVAAKGRDRLSAVKIGQTGLRISSGGQAGLLLPDVATEMNWDAEQFLEAVCRKAGLPTNAWYSPQTQLDIFHGEKIEGQIDPDHLQNRLLAKPDTIRTEDTFRLATLAANNIVAMRIGATPTYVHPEMPDGTVEGIILSVAADPIDNQGAPAPHQHWQKISFRPGLPLQSTLFEFCQQAAAHFSTLGRHNRIRVDVTVLQDPAYHGSMDDHDLIGIDPQQRAILVSANGKNSLLWKPGYTPESLCQAAASGLGIYPKFAAIHSLSIASTFPHLQISQTPVAEIDDQPRPMAVAGSFYPADEAERITLVSQLIEQSRGRRSTTTKRRPLAIMVPHAGLKYSGSVAATVWDSIEFPESLLIIGPKHTPHGVDWGVAPHSRWNLSQQSSIAADVDLSRAIVERVHGMKYDAAAHRREHSIEIELPFVHYLAPQSKIAAIVMQTADWENIVRCAKDLAALLSSMAELPLLVISTDMNHFADEVETRRRDGLALEALRSGDAELLLRTCQQHQISMCGQIPAALVLQTLKEMGRSFVVEPLEYATSADVSGDKTRVVGYAGALIV
jgi:AmmeMemoRadiSam system radical SAM enzyme/AmmeMemoRadiSam system protein B/AmmeMemoRadiSam system protein A